MVSFIFLMFVYFSLIPAKMVRSTTGNASAHKSTLEQRAIKVCDKHIVLR